MDKQKIIIDVLLYELKETKKGLITAGGISNEKTVQHYLNGIYKSIDELINATEKEINQEVVRMSDEYCLSCEQEERTYIGDGEFLCMNCHEITDWNRISIEEEI